jgi:adenylyltransferase/sulfurtransferase
LEFTKTWIPKRSDCSCCARREFRFLDAAHELAAISLCGRNAVHIRGGQNFNFSVLRKKYAVDPSIKMNPHILRFQKDCYDITLFKDGRAIIKGLDDLRKAKAIFCQITG